MSNIRFNFLRANVPGLSDRRKGPQFWFIMLSVIKEIINQKNIQLKKGSIGWNNKFKKMMTKVKHLGVALFLITSAYQPTHSQDGQDGNFAII